MCVLVIVSNRPSNYDPIWYIDTTATHHMAYEHSQFKTYEHVPPKDAHLETNTILLGDDSEVSVHGRGSIVVQTFQNSELLITDVLHVPTLNKNLFSARKLDEKGGWCIIGHRHC